MARGITGVALGVVALLAGCGGSAVASDTPAAAPTTVIPEPAKLWTWDCSLPMTITPMAGPGVTDTELRAAITPAAERIAALGYDVAVGPSAPYRRDVQPAEQVGQVIIVATTDEAEQPELGDEHLGITLPNLNGADPSKILAATIALDSDPDYGGVTANLVTHELGHVVGLDHKDGTVMADGSDAPDDFDAAEVAALGCTLRR